MCMDHSTKICGKCKEAKPIAEFSIRSKAAGTRVSDCKSCVKAKSKAWYENNKARHKLNHQKLELENRDRVNEKKRERRKRISDAKPKIEKPAKEKNWWRKANKEKLSAYRRKWLATNPSAAIADRYRRRLNNALAKVGAKKLRASSDFVGCTWDDLKIHIERQFQPGMTWLNRGDWHIDHIIPLATAKTEADVIALNHFTNLRPMWAKDNLAKGDAIHYLI